MATQIQVKRQGRVLVATLHNPPHAMQTMAMVAQLDELVRQVEADDSVGAVILTGSHPDRFLAHFDVAEIARVAKGAPTVSPAQAAAGIKLARALQKIPGMARLLNKTPLSGILMSCRFHDTLLRMGRSPAVFIAAINGYALGGGCELSLACDFRIMVNGPYGIGQPEALLGFPPGAGGTQRMARLIGRAKALELCLEGVPVMPDEAWRLGLIHQVVPPQQLMDEAMRLAERMSRRSRPAVAAIKQCILEGGSLPLEQGLAFEQSHFLSALGTGYARRAMDQYVAALKTDGELPGYSLMHQQPLWEGRFVKDRAGA